MKLTKELWLLGGTLLSATAFAGFDYVIGTGEGRSAYIYDGTCQTKDFDEAERNAWAVAEDDATKQCLALPRNHVGAILKPGRAEILKSSCEVKKPPFGDPYHFAMVQVLGTYQCVDY